MQATLRFFRHYLAARQLNDDLHDWEADLRRGQLTAVNVALLRAAQVPAGEHDLDTLVAQLQSVLWQEQIAVLVAAVREQCAGARAALAEHPFVAHPGPLLERLAPIEAAMDKTLAQRSLMQDFLRAYGQAPGASGADATVRPEPSGPTLSEK
jgi:hypothetical protein